MPANPIVNTITTGLTNLYLIRGESTILIDAAEHNRADLISRKLHRLGVDPEEISLIILSHTHWDHVGSLPELVEMTKAEVLVHAAELDRLEEGIAVIPPGITAWGRFLAGRIIPGMLPESPVRYLADIVMTEEYPLDAYGISGRLIHTPGHSPGSISLVLEDGRAFVGDMAMSSFPLRILPGLPVLAEMPGKIDESWDKIRAVGAKRIYPSHGHNFNIRWIPDSNSGALVSR